MKTREEVRLKFAHYFLDLKAEMRREDASVSKLDEWARFIDHLIEEGDIPEAARSWRSPRSLEEEILRANKQHKTHSIAGQGVAPHSIQVLRAREALGLTQWQCADLIHRSMRNWQQFERGERRMDPALWELFCIKTRYKEAK